MFFAPVRSLFDSWRVLRALTPLLFILMKQEALREEDADRDVFGTETGAFWYLPVFIIFSCPLHRHLTEQRTGL